MANEIQSLNPEHFLATSNATTFSIFINTPDYRLARTINGWINVDAPHFEDGTIAHFTRGDLVEGYYEALRDARDSNGIGSPFLEGGNLQINELEEN